MAGGDGSGEQENAEADDTESRWDALHSHTHKVRTAVLKKAVSFTHHALWN